MPAHRPQARCELFRRIPFSAACEASRRLRGLRLVPLGGRHCRRSTGRQRDPATRRMAARARGLLCRRPIASHHHRSRRCPSPLLDSEKRLHRAGGWLPPGHLEEPLRNVRGAASLLRPRGDLDLRHFTFHLRVPHHCRPRPRTKPGDRSAVDECDARRRRRSVARPDLHPPEELRRFNVTEEEIFARAENDRIRRLLEFQIDRAEGYFREAEPLLRELAFDARFPTLLMGGVYATVLAKLRKDPLMPIRKRLSLSPLQKVLVVGRRVLHPHFV